MRFLIGAVLLVWASACETTPDTPDVAVEPIADKWVVTDGKVDFTAMKNGDTPVIGTFSAVSGEVNMQDFPDLSGTIEIDLNSLTTGVEERDVNILRYFFEATGETGSIVTFAPERFVGAEFLPLEGADRVEGELQGGLQIGGVTTWVGLPVAVFRNRSGTLIIESRKDAGLELGNLHMAAEKESLMDACGHKSIGDFIGLRFAASAAPSDSL